MAAIWGLYEQWPGSPRAGLTEALREATGEDARLQQCGHRATCVAFSLDLDGDGRPEELVATRSSTWFELIAFGRSDGATWRRLGALRQEQRHLAESQTELWLCALRTGRYRDVPPRYRDLQIGSQRFRSSRPIDRSAGVHRLHARLDPPGRGLQDGASPASRSSGSSGGTRGWQGSVAETAQAAEIRDAASPGRCVGCARPRDWSTRSAATASRCS